MATTTITPRILRPPNSVEKPPSPAGPSAWRERLPVLLVVAVTLTLAVVQYWQYLDVHRHLWYAATHDRNSHYLYTLRLADDVRTGHLLRWVADVNSARVWPPLQDLLSSFALVAGGVDDRLTVWPSVAGWAMSVIFGFLVARRLVPRGGNLAGAVAALFIALSPAHRAYATDAMLESLGAGLTLAVLYAYLVAVQGDGARAGRWLGLALTALFLEKYNYWLLALLAVAGTEALHWRRELWRAVRAYLGAVDWRGLVRSQLRAFSNYVILGAFVLTAVVCVHGDRPFLWRGREIWMYPPYVIIQVVYWIVLVRLVLWWRAAGRERVRGLDVRVQQVIRWHLWPVAFWLALPKHFGPFFWFLSPLNAASYQKSSLAAGLREYAGCVLAEYHVSLACALAAAALLAVAVLAAPALRRGGVLVLVLLLLGTFLSANHPNRKGRFVHSWIAAAWVGAGAGAALLVHGRLTARRPRLHPWLACAALGGLGFAHFAGGVPQAHAAEGGPHRDAPCLLDVTDCYLPYLDGNRPTAVLSAVSIGPMAEWTFFERYGRPDRLEDHRNGFGPPGEPNRQAFRQWLKASPVAAFVFIEELRTPLTGTAWEEVSETQRHAELRDVLNDQQEFRLVRRQEFPRQGCAVTVWKRAE
jgi:hypothetical protein